MASLICAVPSCCIGVRTPCCRPMDSDVFTQCCDWNYGSGFTCISPARVRAAAVDSTHISITWAPAPFPHGPVLCYVLLLSEQPGINPHSYSAVKVLTSP
jgi:hypothetical protein